MGQKVNPLGFRLGVYEDWRAHWYPKNSYGQELKEDLKIRKFFEKQLAKSEVAKIIIDKAGENTKVTIFSARPGLIIGKKGQGVEHLKNLFYQAFKKNVEISVQEVRDPAVNAAIVAQGIAEQLERRASFKRLMKKAGYAALKSRAKGIKICCAGRLGGAEIARSEWLRLGSVPLHTLRSDVDYASAQAKTIYGIVGVKVWICKGEYQG